MAANLHFCLHILCAGFMCVSVVGKVDVPLTEDRSNDLTDSKHTFRERVTQRLYKSTYGSQ